MQGSYFERCFTEVPRPDWVDALARKIPAFEKTQESGDVVLVVTDAGGDLTLAGYALCSSGALCYRIQSDGPVTAEREFWRFMARHHVWITPSIELRKVLAGLLLAQSKPLDGTSFKLNATRMEPDEFIGQIAGTAGDSGSLFG
jgi:hypothetical protein